MPIKISYWTKCQKNDRQFWCGFCFIVFYGSSFDCLFWFCCGVDGYHCDAFGTILNIVLGFFFLLFFFLWIPVTCVWEHQGKEWKWRNNKWNIKHYIKMMWTKWPENGIIIICFLWCQWGSRERRNSVHTNVHKLIEYLGNRPRNERNENCLVLSVL